MSFKVYSGHILKHTSLTVFERKLRDPALISLIEEEAITLYKKKCSEEYCHALDTQDMTDEQARAFVAEDIQEELATMRRGGRSFYDVDFLMDYKAHNGHIYLLHHCEYQSLFDVLKQHVPSIEEYEYSSSVDGSDSLSEADWDARGDEWRAVINKFTPADSGFSSFNHKTDVSGVDGIDESLVSKEKRAHWYAVERVCRDMVNGLEEGLGRKLSDEEAMHIGRRVVINLKPEESYEFKQYYQAFMDKHDVIVTQDKPNKTTFTP